MPRWLGLTSRAMSSTASGTTPFHRDRQIKLLFPDRPLASFPVLYGTLELPKKIVNQAIAGKAFPKTVAGFELDQIAYLFVLCTVFLALVCVNGLFKFYTNVYKGRLGERLLRLMRSE